MLWQIRLGTKGKQREFVAVVSADSEEVALERAQNLQLPSWITEVRVLEEPKPLSTPDVKGVVRKFHAERAKRRSRR